MTAIIGDATGKPIRPPYYPVFDADEAAIEHELGDRGSCTLWERIAEGKRRA